MEFLRSPRSIGLSLGLLIAAGVAGSSAPSSLGPSSGSALANDVSTSTEINCFPEYFSDGECDGDNNNEVCGYDGGDCCSCTCTPGAEYECGASGYECVDPEAPCVDDDDVTSATATNCVRELFSNGECDSGNNNELCGYDGGDCCPCTCVDGEYECGAYYYACIDPEAPCVDDDDITPAIVMNCISESIADGTCDSDNNNEICGYDGGDCCSCTCTSTEYNDCGWIGYNCIDPEAPCAGAGDDDGSGSPSPTPDTPTPTPGTSSATTGSPSPTTGSPSPTPGTPSPTIRSLSPIPGTPSPISGSPSPTPDRPSLAPDTPSPSSSGEDIETPSPASSTVSPTPDTPSPIPGASPPAYGVDKGITSSPTSTTSSAASGTTGDLTPAPVSGVIPSSAAQSLTISTAAFITTFMAGLGVMQFIDWV